MPNGECRPSSSAQRWSATPSPSVSRSSVMRFALGTAAPAQDITMPIIQPFTPLRSSGLGGAFVSATSTSPLGSTSSQRGWSRPLANNATRVPGAGCGIAPAGQPFAGAMLTVGNIVLFGAGNAGVGPLPAETGSLAISLQAESARAVAPISRAGACAGRRRTRAPTRTFTSVPSAAAR